MPELRDEVRYACRELQHGRMTADEAIERLRAAIALTAEEFDDDVHDRRFRIVDMGAPVVGGEPLPWTTTDRSQVRAELVRSDRRGKVVDGGAPMFVVQQQSTAWTLVDIDGEEPEHGDTDE